MNDDTRAKMIEARNHYNAGDYKLALKALEGVPGDKAANARASIQRKLATAKPASPPIVTAFMQMVIATVIAVIFGVLVYNLQNPQGTCDMMAALGRSCDRSALMQQASNLSLGVFVVMWVLMFIIARGLMNRYVR